MKRFIVFMFLIGLRVGASAQPSVSSKITFECTDAPLQAVITEVAKNVGLEVMLEQQVSKSPLTRTLKFGNQSLQLAMAQVLNKTNLEWKIMGRTLLVGKPAFLKSIQKGREFRQEILLEHVPASKVIRFLSGLYPLVEFTNHPTMNGFYAVGSHKDINLIKKDVPELDKPPEQP